MIRVSVSSLALFLLLLSSACSRSNEGSSSHSFRVFTENGVTIAETTGGPKYAGEIFEYIEVLRLNQDESQEASLLARPYMYMMDENGAFYVPDSSPERIACFGPKGNYSHDIGRQGEGPGEYLSPELQSIQKEIVSVYDRRLLRTSFFKTDGTFIESISLQRDRFIPQRMHRGPEGEKILVGQEDEGGINQDIYVSAVAIVLSADGDSIASMSTQKVKRGHMFLLEEYRMSGMPMVHYNGWPNAWYSPSTGILLTCGVETSMQWYDLDGQLRRAIRLDVSTDPLTDDDKEAVMSTLRQRLSDADDERSHTLARRYIELVEFRNPKAFWFSAYPDEDGYIWAMRAANIFARSPDSPISAIYRVFSPEGEYLGETEWIATEATVSRGHLLTVQENEETGELELIVYQIRPTVEGLKYP